MKKLLIVMLLSTIVLAGCNNQPTDTETQTWANNESVNENTNTEDVLDNNNNNMAKEAIKEYLDNADMEGKGAEVKKWDKIVVDYIGRLDDETVFDTSIESVAKAADKYMEQRNYDEGLEFAVWAGQMIKGFDEGVVGMKVGQTKTITIPAAEAYGEWTEEALITQKIADIPNADQFEEGMEVYSPYGQKFKVHKKTKDELVIDTNHELAGKDLIFDITVKEIK